ncbi:MAG: LuxR C-terminal-related transcriptional regulator [Myxococcota bacterium]
MGSGILDIVEGAYDTASDGQRWLVQLNERFASRFTGVVAWGGHVITRTAEGPPVFHNAHLSGVDDAMAVFGPMHEDMDPDFAAAIFPTGTQCALFSEHWGRVKDSRVWGRATLEASELLLGYLNSRGGDDLLFAYSYDRTGTGVMVSAIVKGATLSEGARELNRRAAVHVAAGLRLRRALATVEVGEASEAVLETDGRLAHAEGPAADGQMRAQLREAVRRIDRARTSAVRNDEAEALNLWQGLVEGRWSVIDRHDTDGRRYYVAIANPPGGVSARQLSEVEAQVVAQAVAGEPNGVIAYSLGVAESTVAGHLTMAMRKLGAASRMELVRLGHALGA